MKDAPIQVMDRGKGGAHRVPDQLKKLGAVTKPKPPKLSRCKIVLMSRYGHGTTTFLGSNRNLVILDVGGEGHSILHQQACRIPIKDYDHYFETLAALCTLKKQGDCPYDMICFDRGGKWVDMLCRQIVKEWNEGRGDDDADGAQDIGEVGMKGAGHAKLRNRVVAHLDMVFESGFGWCVTPHLVDRVVNEEIVSELAMFPGIRDYLMSTADLRLTLTRIATTEDVTKVVKKVIGGKERKVEVNAGEQRVKKYILDVESVDDARRGDSRVSIRDRIKLPTYNSKSKPSKLLWDVLNEVYEAARQDRKSVV